MAKTVTIQISDDDYDDLVSHLAQDKAGRPLVAVIADKSAPGSFLKRDIDARIEEIEAREKITLHDQFDTLAEKRGEK